MKKHSRVLNLVVVFSVISILFYAVMYLIYGLSWRAQITPKIQEDQLVWQGMNFWAGVFLPFFGVLGLLCAIGLGFFRDWARKLFIGWFITQRSMVYGQILLAKFFTAKGLEHMEHARTLSGDKPLGATAESTNAVLSNLNDAVSKSSIFDFQITVETFLIVAFIYYLTRFAVRDQFEH